MGNDISGGFITERITLTSQRSLRVDIVDDAEKGAANS
jgi:hypothetical protein